MSTGLSRDEPVQPHLHPQLLARFATTFGGEPSYIAFAPARVNLLGEHIDYCGGTVLPMTIARGTWIAARPATHRHLRARSDNAHGVLDTVMPGLLQDCADVPWGRYLVGVGALLAEAGVEAPDGLDLFIAGDIPTGGLSSSASLCVAYAVLLEALADVPLPGGRPALARLCQQVEHDYVGVHCGIMDQAVIALSTADHGLALDCRDLSHRHLPWPAENPLLLIVDSGRARTLEHAPYNARQAEARAAETKLAQATGVARALCEYRPAEFVLACSAAADALTHAEARRARHCAGEQWRVDAAIAALARGDMHSMGAAMSASHASLRDAFEVSCPELDLIVDSTLACAGVYGARLTGAGFGGAAIVLVERDALAAVQARLASDFTAAFGRIPPQFVARSGGGARLLRAPQ